MAIRSVFTISIFILAMIQPLSTCSAEAPKAARSVHFWYPADEATIYYNEVRVQKSVPGSYFCVCGFTHGYFGIQELFTPGDKVVIFSVWDAGDQNDPNIVPEDRRVKVLHQGKDVRVSRFGNEGTGGKSMFSYNWKLNQTYKCLVKAKQEGKWTTYSAYFYLPEEERWKHLASFQTLANGDLIKNCYSFVEDFRRDGKSAKQIRTATYGQGWVKTLEEEWMKLTTARFTADRTPTMNINAYMEEERFVLTTGGDVKNETPLKSYLHATPIGLTLP